MSNTLSLIRVYGYKLRPHERDDEPNPFEADDDDALLDHATNAIGEDYEARSAARKALGVEFELYSWGGDEEPMPRALVASDSIVTVYDDGIMPAEAPEANPEWNAKLDRVVAALNLNVEGEPRWYYLARYF